jgi:hypothetical protein
MKTRKKYNLFFSKDSLSIQTYGYHFIPVFRGVLICNASLHHSAEDMIKAIGILKDIVTDAKVQEQDRDVYDFICELEGTMVEYFVDVMVRTSNEGYFSKGKWD